jgi:hypothetical protein
MPHYHIRWSDKAPLDWQCFATLAEAEATARELVRPGETYTFEEQDGACPRCRGFKAALKKSVQNIA